MLGTLLPVVDDDGVMSRGIFRMTQNDLSTDPYGSFRTSLKFRRRKRDDND